VIVCSFWGHSRLFQVILGSNCIQVFKRYLGVKRYLGYLAVLEWIERASSLKITFLASFEVILGHCRSFQVILAFKTPGKRFVASGSRKKRVSRVFWSFQSSFSVKTCLFVIGVGVMSVCWWSKWQKMGSKRINT